MTGALNPVITVQVGSYVSGTLKTLKCDYNTELDEANVVNKVAILKAARSRARRSADDLSGR